MAVQIITVPFASGRFDVRTGRGPGHLLRTGLAQHLRDNEIPVGTLQSLHLPPEKDTEVAALFSLQEGLGNAVRAVIASGDFPLILGGECSSTVGAVSGLDQEHLGVIWFDAHGDYNTPETTTSGNLDGMALAILTGQCWQRMAEGISGFAPIEEARVMHLGGRNFDEEENILMYGSEMYLLLNEDIQHRGVAPLLEQGMRDLADAGVEHIHLHFDLDVLDPNEAPANGYDNAPGLSVAQALEAIALLRRRFPITSAALTAYDPAYDPEGRTAEAAQRIALAIVAPIESSLKN